MDHQPDPTKNRRRLRMPLANTSPRTRSVVIATGMLALAATPLAGAATGQNLREGVRNGTATRETQIISNVASSSGTTGGYSTRQSNLSSSGGGAVYGCRSAAGGSAATPTAQNPCIRANNLSRGLAFEFNASNGETAGLITVGTGGDGTRPFTTNATGVATGLNSDEVDGLDAAQIVALARTKTGLDADTVDGLNSTDLQAKFAQVGSGGAAGATRGVPTGGVTNPGPPDDGTWQVVFTGDQSNCAIAATVTGTAPGQVTVTPTTAGGNTTVDVRTFNGAGAATDRGFHLTVSC